MGSMCKGPGVKQRLWGCKEINCTRVSSAPWCLQSSSQATCLWLVDSSLENKAWIEPIGYIFSGFLVFPKDLTPWVNVFVSFFVILSKLTTVFPRISFLVFLSLSLFLFFKFSFRKEREGSWEQEWSHTLNIKYPMGEDSGKCLPQWLQFVLFIPRLLPQSPGLLALISTVSRHSHHQISGCRLTKMPPHRAETLYFFQVSLPAPLFIRSAWSLAFPTQPRVPGVGSDSFDVHDHLCKPSLHQCST